MELTARAVGACQIHRSAPRRPLNEGLGGGFGTSRGWPLTGTQYRDYFSRDPRSQYAVRWLIQVDAVDGTAADELSCIEEVTPASRRCRAVEACQLCRPFGRSLEFLCHGASRRSDGWGRNDQYRRSKKPGLGFAGLDGLDQLMKSRGGCLGSCAVLSLKVISTERENNEVKRGV